ncbi:MAG TPA: metal-dependent hydrolase, partial [Actinoplanes sp.]
MGRTRKPVVEVRRSQRRRRTVSAYRDGERVVVLIPDRFS